MKKNLIPTIVLASLICVPMAAQARTLDNIIRPYQSARSAGMGGVRYSTGLFDENFFGNPARIADNPRWRIDIVNVFLEVNSGAISNAGDISGSGDTLEKVANTMGKNNHVRVQTVIPAYYSPRFLSDDNSFAVGLIHSTQMDLDLRRNLQAEPNVFVDIGPAATFARKFLKERLAVGITAHYMYRAATRETFSTIDYIKGDSFKSVKDVAGEGSNLDFDLGFRHNLAWKPKGWNFQGAFAMNNLLGGTYKEGSPDFMTGSQPAPPKQPRTYNTGISGKKPGFLGFSSALFAFEIQDIGNNDGGSLFRTLHMGTELEVKDTIFLRGGINQGYFTAGVGFDLPVLKLDLATYGEEMSLNVGGLQDRRYAIRIGLAI